MIKPPYGAGGLRAADGRGAGAPSASLSLSLSLSFAIHGTESGHGSIAALGTGAAGELCGASDGADSSARHGTTSAEHGGIKSSVITPADDDCAQASRIAAASPNRAINPRRDALRISILRFCRCVRFAPE
jgi:hypothetical protein